MNALYGYGRSAVLRCDVPFTDQKLVRRVGILGTGLYASSSIVLRGESMILLRISVGDGKNREVKICQETAEQD